MESKWVCIVQAAVICIFSMSAWLGTNAIWVENPLLLEKLPNSWSLPSWLVLVIQLANVAPLLYIGLKKLRPNLLSDWTVSRLMIFIAAVASLLLIFTWDKTTGNNGTALIILAFFMAVADVMSVYVFLPNMKKDSTTLQIGLGLGAIVPVVLGLIQGIRQYFLNTKDDVSLFTISTFFIVITVLLVLSLLSSVVIQYYFEFDTPKLENSQEVVVEEIKDEKDQPDDSETQRIIDGQETRNYLAPASYFILGWMNFLTYGIIPAIQPFSCLPYSFVTYDLVVKLSALLKPLGCYFALIVEAKRLAFIWLLAVIATLMGAYHIVLATFSLKPILHDMATGSALAVLSALILAFISAYIKTSLGRMVESTGKDQSKYRVFGQTGSFLGAVLGFVLVIANVFQEVTRGGI